MTFIKNTICSILTFILLSLLMFGFSACRDTVEPFFAVIDGDIVGNRITVDLNGIASTEFTYISDGTEITASGWELNTVITQVELLYEDNYLMITATDGVSALIDAALTGAIYLYYGEGGVLSAKTSDYPSVCSIKDIAEITVITKETAIDGYKILSRDETEFVSRGNAKLRLFNRIAENLMNGNIAYKYLPKADRSVSSFTMKEDDVVYFTDYDIIKNADLKMLEWKNGGLIIEIGQTEKIVFGFAAGTDLMVYDAYDQMKSALDGGEKVMFILPDGLSWQQAEYFSEYLNTLDLSNASLALTVNTAISPVALASIVTGETPYVTGINFGPGEARAILKPLVSDIFDYAVSIGKSVSYLEGNGNLIVTNVLPEYALSDALVFENAKSAINADTDLIFVHFHEIDDVNHDYGPLSNESKTKIIYIESYIEYLISQFDGTVIIVPDHGHITLYDEQEKPYGKHGLFTNLDMFIPYYVFGEDE